MLVSPAAILDALTPPRPLVLLDAIASFAVDEVAMDLNGIDAVVAASQKAIAVPPGLGFVAFSARASERMARVERERYYLDLRRYESVRDGTRAPFTPAVHLVQMVQESLGRMREVGWKETRERHRRAAAAFTAAMEALGMGFVSESPSAAVLVMRPPDGVDANALLADLAERHGIVMAGGQGALAGSVLRTGFLGSFPGRTIRRLAGAVADSLERLGAPGDAAASDAALAGVAEQEGLFDAT